MDEQGMSRREELETTTLLLELELAEQGDVLTEAVRRRNRLELARDRGNSHPGLEAAAERVRRASAYRRTLLRELADALEELDTLEQVAA